jgi:hypothetical protein
MVVTGRIVAVQTFGGWQWSDTDPTTEWDYVAPPFRAEVTPKIEVRYDKPIRTLQGRVVEKAHELNGYSVLLSQRHVDWDGDVNITLRSTDGREIRGFGSIDLASFDG